MDIIIPDSWLRKFLDTKASPKEIAQYTSLCGPSIEKLEKISGDYIYKVEITTNRMDSAGVMGFAKEISAILPRFGIDAKFLNPTFKIKTKFTSKVNYLDVKIDKTLCSRFSAVLIKNVKIKKSPPWVENEITAVGLRPINNVVDISNFIMHELAQPVHTFDYDKIKGAKMILRISKKGEKLTTLDGKTHELTGNDIVIEDGEHRLIDLAGIMGGLNSAVDAKTKNVLLFVQNYNPVYIRKTVMRLAHRTEAASLFEKGIDPELVTLGIKRGIELFQLLADGQTEKQILDIYPVPYKTKKVVVEKKLIDQYLGITIDKKEIEDILVTLGFTVWWKAENLFINVPSFRATDINIPEDVTEEIARIYGYHNIPSRLMEGKIPDKILDSPFSFEYKIKNILKSTGAIEVYSLSLVGKDSIDKYALKLKNPLGNDSEYLRTSLLPSLVQVAEVNSGEKEIFHLFEMAKIYLPRLNDLPEEKIMLAGIFSGYSYREAKGQIEMLFDELNINYTLSCEDDSHFKPTQRIVLICKNNILGEFGVLVNNYIYYEFEVSRLMMFYRAYKKYKDIPKYPPQIEDITFIIPEKTKIGKVLSLIKEADKLVSNSELIDMYKNSYTFRVWYQHTQKTLSDQEVEKIRKNIINSVIKNFGASVK